MQRQPSRRGPSIGASQQTYRKSADGVDGEGVNLVVAHLCGISRRVFAKGIVVCEEMEQERDRSSRSRQ